jgi:hypothetical protein
MYMSDNERNLDVVARKNFINFDEVYEEEGHYKHSRSSERLLIYHYKKMQTQLFGTGEAITWALLAISMRW